MHWNTWLIHAHVLVPAIGFCMHGDLSLAAALIQCMLLVIILWISLKADIVCISSCYHSIQYVIQYHAI